MCLHLNLIIFSTQLSTFLNFNVHCLRFFLSWGQHFGYLRIVFCSSTFICFLEFLNHFTCESHSIRSSCLYQDCWPLIPWGSLLSVLSAGVTSVYNCAWPFTWVLGFELLFSLTCYRQSCLVSHFSMPWTLFHVQYLFNSRNDSVMLWGWNPNSARKLGAFVGTLCFFSLQSNFSPSPRCCLD